LTAFLSMCKITFSVMYVLIYTYTNCNITPWVIQAISGFWLFDKDYYVDEFEIKAPCKKDYDTEEEYRFDCKKFIKELLENVNIHTLT
jgi:hypothetical protein